MTEIDMDRIARLVTDAGHFALIAQTGGGTATLYAGEVIDDRYRVCAGPGWFAGPGWTFGDGKPEFVQRARATTDDFYVGPDDDGEDDDAVYRATDTDDEASLAAEIVRQLSPTRGESS